jgi:glycine cleavage system H protein
MAHKPFSGSVPDGFLYDTRYDMWVQKEGDAIRVGITSFGVFLAGEIIAFTGKPKGAEVTYGRGLGTVESAKTVLAVHAPCSFTLIEVNEALEERPRPINSEPYAAWLILGTPTDWAQDVARMVDAATYRTHILSVEPEATFT